MPSPTGSTSPDNPFFAKAMANRIWSYFFGRGIIDPVDDIRASNPPINPALLDALDEGFRRSPLRPAAPDAHDRQLAHVSASLQDNEWNADDDDQLLARRRPAPAAEELFDASLHATGAGHFPGGAGRFRAEQLPDPQSARVASSICSAGRARVGCECERRSDVSLVQALNLVNGATIADAVADPKGRIAKLMLGGKSERGHRRRAVLWPLSAGRPAEELRSRRTYLSDGARATERRICSGHCSTARDFFTSISETKGTEAMLNIPGRAVQTCEGPTRRELMRIGSLGLAGLHLPGFFLWQRWPSSQVAKSMPAHAGSITPRPSSCSSCRADRATSTSGIRSPTRRRTSAASSSRSRPKSPVSR